ncbi:MAG TPA: Ig-like domain-containing protein, partial [Abditibacteriaceae bacterium]
EKDGEWNFVQDPPSAALVCSTWPTPILFNGEGGTTNSGRRVTYEMPEHNPMTVAYTAYPGVGFGGDRLSWDTISSMVAIRGAAPWYQVVSNGSNVTDPVTGSNTWQVGENRGHSYLVLDPKRPKSEVETALEDMQGGGKGRPANLLFNTAYYSVKGGTSILTSRGAVDNSTTAAKAFDVDDRTAWEDKAATSWIQCQYGDGRKYPVTSYTVLFKDLQSLPHAMQLSGSNDGGANWTVLDTRNASQFSQQGIRREFTFTVVRPAKWNIYRLNVTTANKNAGIQISSIELNEAICLRPGVAVKSVTLDQRALTLPANGRATLNATIAPRDTFEREVAWGSSDPGVAEVRRIGEQIAVVVGKKPGTCTVTATIDKVKQVCMVIVTPSTLPVGWNYNELNTPPIPGSVLVAGGKFTLTGSGHAMTSWWERVRDQGVFVSQSVKGDIELSARLTSLAPNVGNRRHAPGGTPTASGLMIRESLTEKDSRYLLIQVEASGNLVARWRDKTGDQDDNQANGLGTVTLPIHLKLVQTGKEIQVFTSDDGRNWGQPRISHTANFDNKSRIGLFVSSGNTFSSTTSVFDSVAMGK